MRTAAAARRVLLGCVALSCALGGVLVWHTHQHSPPSPFPGRRTAPPATPARTAHPDQPAKHDRKPHPDDHPDDHPDGHPLAPARGRPPPFVFVKTVTASAEVVVNILHRVAEREGLRIVLPRDGARLGWPFSRDLPFDYVRRPNEPGTFDALFSGYARRQAVSQGQLVPGAAFFAVLDDPAVQVRFAFRLLGPRFPGLSEAEFAAKAALQHWEALSMTERKVVHDSQAHSLGLLQGLGKAAAVAAAHSLESRLRFVLVGGHLDESLVVLASLLNLSLSDVVYARRALLGPHSAQPIPGAEAQRDARARNLGDWTLYRHFNASLWQHAAALPRFAADLAAFRALLHNASAAACPTSAAPLPTGRSPDGRGLHSALQGPAAPPLEGPLRRQFRCLRLGLNSSEYVLLLKRQRGYAERQCQPKKRLVMIKTHKTGSSTLTNLFHRFATKHKLRVALPKDNLYLGWPFARNMLRSYEQFDASPQMDILCSGHAVYHRGHMDRIVPGATYFTVLRDPVEHFLSSWAYWHIADHFRDRAGLSVTALEFLRDPERYLALASASDARLLRNNQAYDLGLAGLDPAAALRRAGEMEAEFGLVMLTEHMDESLVLLKRQMCWELDDVSYFRLKVAKKPRPAVSAEVAGLVRNLTYIDTILYEHFNRTFWRRVAAEDGFEAELAELREYNAQIARDCRLWHSWGEDRHRKVLTEADLGRARPSPLEYRCHLTQMDSMAFVKYLKFRRGRPARECQTQYFHRITFNYVRTLSRTGDLLALLLYRVGLRRSSKMALPADLDSNVYAWPNASHPAPAQAQSKPQLQAQVLYAKHTRYSAPPHWKGRPTNALCCGFAPFDRPSMDAINPRGKYIGQYIAAVDHPVDHFVHVWGRLGLGELLGCSMVEFLRHPEGYEAQLDAWQLGHLKGGLAFVLGGGLGKGEASAEAIVGELSRTYWAGIVLGGEHFETSLVLLRRVMCWDYPDVAFVGPEQPPSPDLPVETAGLITAYRGRDMRLYALLVARHIKLATREILVDAEVADARRLRADLRAACLPLHGKLTPPERVHEVAVGADGPRRLCHLLHLGDKGFRLLYQRLGTGGQFRWTYPEPGQAFSLTK